MRKEGGGVPRRWGAEPHPRTPGSLRGGRGSALLRSCGSGSPCGALRTRGARPGGGLHRARGLGWVGEGMEVLSLGAPSPLAELS